MIFRCLSWRKNIFTRVIFICIGVSGIFIFSLSVTAQESIYGPMIEIGGGMSGFRMQSRPDWAAKYYGAGLVTGAIRLYRGFSVLAGKDYGYGKEPRPSFLDYGKDVKLNTDEGTYLDGMWYGVRYEIPMSIFDKDIMGIDFIYASSGMTQTKFGIRSAYLVKEDEKLYEEGPKGKNFRTATVSAPYAALAARWRLDTEDSRETGSWFGAYGLDIGVRYIRFNESSIRHDNIMMPKSNFNWFQIFVIGFIKIKLFY